MSTYLVVVLLLLPGSSGTQPLTAEAHREVAAFSSPAACQRHAERLAAQQRTTHAELLRRTGGRAVGTCHPIGEPT